MDTDINLPDASPTTTSGAGSLPHNDDVSLNSSESTLGRHLARRLVQIGVSDVFSVPDYFNITLLDHLIAEPGLNLVGCCDDLNAGYAADGYARSRGIGACVVTFDIRGLGVLNAIACAYSENLPLICIVGGPDSIACGSNLHHSIAVPDFNKELLCFQTVTCYQAVVNNLEDAHELIDTAISTALKQSKPVYISISCNLPAIPHPSFSREQVPLCLSSELSNQIGLEAAVEAAAQFLNKAVKPIMVGGPKLRVAKACGAFVELADSSGYALSLLPSAKGMVPEHHPHFVGIYEGPLSTAFCEKIVESADAYLFVGLMFDDHTSVDYLHLLNEKAISVHPDQVVIGNGPSFSYFLMKDFLKALAKRLKQNKTAYENYHRISVPEEHPLKSPPKEPLRVNVLFEHIQKMLSGNTAVIADTWNTWYNCQKLKLPDGCGYESQMQYQSIGWSVGATLGYAQAATNKRVIACIGDGSFQVTALDVSTMISYGQKSIIFLINKGGYTVYNKMKYWNNPALVDAIPKGEGKCWTAYNVIKNWNYTALVDSIHNGEGKCWTAKVFCEEELIEAIKTATGKKKDSLCFIEVIVHKYNSKELLELGHMAPYLLYSD